MIIKSYVENTAAAALKKIREEMGEQALILHTRHIRNGRASRKIEVTACIDEALVPSLKSLINPEAATTDDIVPRGVESERVSEGPIPEIDNIIAPSSSVIETVPSRLRNVHDRLMDFDVPSEQAEILLAEVRNIEDVDQITNSAIHNALKTSIAKLINDKVSIPAGSKVMFIGTSGAGKTSTLAKMAAELTAFRRTKVRLTSFDTQKISAHEEVGGYADLLDAPYEVNPQKELKAAKNEVVLIDTPSLSYSANGIASVQSLINLARPNLVFMVLSVCNRAKDLIEFKEGIQTVQPDLLIATHLDETRRWGGMLAAAVATGIPLAFVTNSPGGVGELHVPEPEKVIAKMMNGGETRHE